MDTLNCKTGNDSMDVWVIIIIIILVMVVYSYISSKITDRKKIKARETTVPIIPNTISTKIDYKIVLSDGRLFDSVQILGSVEGDSDEQFSFGGWEGMLIIQNENSKKIYIKKSSIRYVEEI